MTCVDRLLSCEARFNLLTTFRLNKSLIDSGKPVVNPHGGIAGFLGRKCRHLETRNLISDMFESRTLVRDGKCGYRVTTTCENIVWSLQRPQFSCCLSKDGSLGILDAGSMYGVPDSGQIGIDTIRWYIAKLLP